MLSSIRKASLFSSTNIHLIRGRSSLSFKNIGTLIIYNLISEILENRRGETLAEAA